MTIEIANQSYQIGGGAQLRSDANAIIQQVNITKG